MILIKVLFSVLIISLEYSVLCSNEDNKSVNIQSGTRSARQRYKFNHPPETESYQSIPVAIVYDDEGIRKDKSLEPKLSTTTEKLIVKYDLPETKSTNNIPTSTVSNDSNDIEVKMYRQNKNSNQKEVKLKTHFENVHQIPVAVVYDDPNEEPNNKRNVVKAVRERVRGFILRKLNDSTDTPHRIKATTRKPADNKSHQYEVRKEHGNSTSENTETLNPNKKDSLNSKTDEITFPNKEKTSDSSKTDHNLVPQNDNIKNKLSKSEIETTKKLGEIKNNENTALTKPKEIETHKEHGKRTSLMVDTKDILSKREKQDKIESIAYETETKPSLYTKKGIDSLISEQNLESENNNSYINIPKGNANTNKSSSSFNTTKPYLKDIQKENGNRTSENTRETRRRVDRKHEIKVAGTESSNLQTSKEVETVTVPKFEKRTRGRDPVVPIIESENRVYSQNGGFQYSYEGGDGTKAFEKGELRKFDDEKAGAAVVGSFSYKDMNGNDFSVSYTADEHGYRPVGAHLPTPPPIPPAIARALLYLATKPTPDPETVTNYYKDY